MNADLQRVGEVLQANVRRIPEHHLWEAWLNENE